MIPSIGKGVKQRELSISSQVWEATQPLWETVCLYLFEADNVFPLSSAQFLWSCPTLCDPMDCSSPGFSVHGISHGVCCHALLQGDLPNPRIKHTSPALQAYSLPVCPWEAPCVFPQFSSVQSLSRVGLLGTPWIAAHQASLSITNSRSSPRLMSIESVMPSSHLILCHPLLLLPPIPPSINESALRMRWPKYWSFSFSIIPSKEIPGLISFTMDWLDLLAVQGTQESSPTPQFKSINSSALSFLHSPTLTSIHDHRKNHSLG